MAITDFLFKSDRDIEAPKLQREQLGRVTDMINRIGGQSSGFEGITDVSGLNERFGISPFSREKYSKSLKDTYGSARRNLATQIASNRKTARRRMQGGEAMPESVFQPVDAQAMSAMGSLDTQEAGALTESYDKEQQYTMDIASFLSNVLGKSDAFKTWKQGAMMQGEGMRMGQVGNLADSLDDSSLFEDIAGAASTVKKLVTKPPTPGINFNFGG